MQTPPTDARALKSVWEAERTELLRLLKNAYIMIESYESYMGTGEKEYAQLERDRRVDAGEAPRSFVWPPDAAPEQPPSATADGDPG